MSESFEDVSEKKKILKKNTDALKNELLDIVSNDFLSNASA